MTTPESIDNTILSLKPPSVSEATNPVVGAHYGVPKRVYDLKPDGLKVDIDPPLAGNPGDVIALVLNGRTVSSKPVNHGEENSITTQYIPKGLLLTDRLNELVYTITRGSNNMGTSTPVLTLLYNAVGPGMEDRTPGDRAHSELELILPQDVIEKGIDADRAKLGVQVCFSYPYCRAHDVIWLNCDNKKDVYHTVTVAEAPAIPSAQPTTVCVMVDEAVFKLAGDNPRFVFSYTVTDQLGNGPDSDSKWSGLVLVDVHLKETRLVAPFLVKPAVSPIDPLAYPNGVTVRVEHLSAQDGDKAQLIVLNAIDGTPAFAQIKLNTNKRANFLLTAQFLANHQDMNPLRFHWILNGDRRNPSSELKLTILKLPAAPLFINGPYHIAPAGRLKDVVIRVGTEAQPVVNAKVSVTLPIGFSYSDAGTGEREFITDAYGLITVSGLKGSSQPSEARLSATYGNQTGTASVLIQAHGPLGRVEVGSLPYVVAMSHDGTRAYVTCPDANSICVIDTLANRPTTYFNIGKSCRYIAVSLDDAIIYVTHVTSPTVSFIDTATGRVIKTVNTAPNPSHITLSPNGTELYVSHEASTTISLINTTTAVARPVVVSERPQGGAFTNNGKLLYICIYYPQFFISIIDTENQRVLENIPVAKGAWTCVLSPDNRYLYVAHQDTNLISVIDTATRKVVKTLSVDSYAMHIVVSANGAFLYVSLWHSQKVAVIDTTTFAIRFIPAAGYLRGLAITPDDSRLYVCDSASGRSTVEVLQAEYSATSGSALGSMSIPELEYIDPQQQ